MSGDPRDVPAGCDPVRVTGFVDGALPPGERDAMAGHLAACPPCRAQADGERAISASLRALRPPDLPHGLATRVQARMRRPVLLRRRVWIPSLAAMIALVLFLRGAAPFVALEVALDHGHCFGKPRLPAQVFTSDPVELASWYEAHGEEIPLVPSGTAGLELVGGRFCRLIDRRVAHVYYSGKDQQLSVYVIPGSVRFDRSFLWSRNGTTVNLIHTGGANVAVVSPDAASVAAFRRSFERTVADAAAAAPR